MKNLWSIILLLSLTLTLQSKSLYNKRSFFDQSITHYANQRLCWWHEICKEEFKEKFQCRCPSWMFCRSPGKNYNGYCSITDSGYVWDQSSLLKHDKKLIDNFDYNY